MAHYKFTYILTYLFYALQQSACCSTQDACRSLQFRLSDRPSVLPSTSLSVSLWFLHVYQTAVYNIVKLFHPQSDRLGHLVFLPRPYSITEFQCQHAQRRRKIHIRYKNAFLDQYHRLQNALLFITLFLNTPKTATFDDLLLKVLAFVRGR